MIRIRRSGIGPHWVETMNPEWLARWRTFVLHMAIIMASEARE